MMIRELVTHLGFDVDFGPLNKFDDKIKDTQDGLGEMGAAADAAVEQVKSALVKIRNLLIGFTVAAGASAVSLAAVVKSAANAGDEIANTAPLLGFTAEEFQKYRYAAKLAGVENEAFTASTQFLLRTIGDARTGNEAAVKSFARLGITVGQLQGKSTAEVYGMLADKLSAIEDPAVRASIAIDILGRSGARMGGLLAKGRGEMEALMGDVEAFGMFTAESAQAADDLNDSLDRVLFFFRGIKNELGQGLFPVFRKILDEFRAWLTVHRETIKAGLAKAIQFLTWAIERGWAAIKRVVRAFETMIRAMGGVRNAAYLVAIALGALLLPLLGPLFVATKGLMFLLVPFIRLHTLITLVTFALGALMPIWALFTSAVAALAATKIIGWLVAMAGGYRALAAAIIIPTAALLAQAAALAAIFLIAEDFTEWVLGENKSIFGQWLGSFDEIPKRIRKVWEDIKEVFREGGAFISAVFRGDFKEAFRLFNDLQKPISDAALATGRGAIGLLGKIPIPPPGSGMGGTFLAGAGAGQLPGSYAFAAPSSSEPGAPRRGGPPRGYSLGVLGAPGADGGPELRPPGAAPITNRVNVKVEVALPKGSPAEHAQEIAEHVDRAIQRQVEHSLQQTTPPGK